MRWDFLLLLLPLATQGRHQVIHRQFDALALAQAGKRRPHRSGDAGRLPTKHAGGVALQLGGDEAIPAQPLQQFGGAHGDGMKLQKLQGVK